MAKRHVTSVILECSTDMNEMFDDSKDKTRGEAALDFISHLYIHKLLHAPKSHQVGVWVLKEELDEKIPICEPSPDFNDSLVEIQEMLKVVKNKPGDPLISIDWVLDAFDTKFTKTPPEHKIILLTTLRGKSGYDEVKIRSLGRMLAKRGDSLQVILFQDKKNSQSLVDETFVSNLLMIDTLSNICHVIKQDANFTIQVANSLAELDKTARSKFKSYWEISPDLRISVNSYSKATQEVMDSLKKYSKLSESNSLSTANGLVKVDRVYHEHDDPAMRVIDADKIIKGVYYGRQLVPIPSYIKEEMKFTDERQLKLMGFTDKKKVPRHYMIGGVDIVVPVPVEKNILAFNSMVDALEESSKVAIVRCVYRKNSPPKLAAMFPYVERSKNFRAMFLSIMPTGEDIREYSFNSLKESNEEQKSLIEEMVDKMDLTAFRKENEEGQGREILQPETLQNPITNLLNRNIIHRGVYGGTDILDFTEETMEEMHPERVTHAQIKELGDLINRLFALEAHDIEKAAAKARLYWQSLIHQQNEAAKLREAESVNPKGDKAGGDKDDDYVKEISMIHPVSDFNNMRKNKKVDLMEKAMKQMAAIIEKLINESLKGSYYEKALECLQELRKGCLEEDEVEFFNKYLIGLKSQLLKAGKEAFWNLVIERGVSLISNVENRRSNISEADSIKFLQESENIKESKMDEEPLNKDGLDDIE